ncbi:hypothetical protein O988_08294 [Pseudogymnoascus sp. VKM F-3808]|nr:hypothetical protein O988_08294 [Pseudogymnoascus sp. VKM F-3808]
MPSQKQQNTGNPSGNSSSNSGPSMGFSRADLDAARSLPAYDPLAAWATNMSRDDNPFSDCRFEFDAMEMEKLAVKKPALKKSTQKKDIEKRTTQGKRKTK